MGAVVDPVRVLGEVVEALLGLGVARVADEAVGLGQRRGADEVGVGLHREAGGDAGAALDAGDRLGDVDHRLGLDDVLALGRLAGGQQPRGDAADLGPVRRLHVGDQVLDHRHVPHRLDTTIRAFSAAPPLPRYGCGLLRGARAWASPICVLQARSDWPLIFIPQEPQIAARQEQRTASEPSSLSLAWRIPSRTRERRVEVDLELLPEGALARLGLVAADLQRVGSAIGSVGPLLRLPLGDRHVGVADLGARRRSARGRCA